jgi:hypothetical protein
MSENRGSSFSYRSLFWPFLLIGGGLIWLLANLEIIEPVQWYTVVRLWPIFLIAIGLDILFGRRSPIVGAVIGLGAVGLVVALLLLAPSLNLAPDVGELKTLNFSESLGSANSASIDLDLERYATTIDALEDSGDLFVAELDTVTDVEFTARGGTDKSISIRPRGDSSFGFEDWFSTIGRNARWEIGLSPEVPIDLVVDVGSGPVTLDTAGLDFSEFSLDGGSGSVNLDLPASSDRYRARIKGGSGSFDITFEDGASVDAFFDVGSGSFGIEIGDDVDIELEIDGGSGSVTIDVPSGVAVQVLVDDAGSGSVRVPGSFTLVDDGGDDDRDTGTWESSGFSSAMHKIIIVFEGGSGSFTLR